MFVLTMHICDSEGCLIPITPEVCQGTAIISPAIIPAIITIIIADTLQCPAYVWNVAEPYRTMNTTRSLEIYYR